MWGSAFKEAFEMNFCIIATHKPSFISWDSGTVISVCLSPLNNLRIFIKIWMNIIAMKASGIVNFLSTIIPT